MAVFLLKKILVLLPTFFGVTLIAFVFIRMLPGDPVTLMAGEKSMPPERHARLMKEFGYDKPVLVQYGIYLKEMAHGNLGARHPNRCWRNF
jgi:dipeptide transport system permease protein